MAVPVIKESTAPPADLDVAAILSTHMNVKYSINNFMPVIEVEYADGNIELRLDMLDRRLTRMLSIITEWRPVLFDGTEHITTLCYRVYGNTTIWWVVMMYNGFVHPLEIEPGTVIKMPSLPQINEYLLAVKRKIGKVVQI